MLRNNKKTIIIGIILLLIIIPLFYLIWWVSTPYQAQEWAIQSMNSTEQVTVTNSEYILFEPTEEKRSIGIIIYPGGRVTPESYAVLGNKLAQDGYLTSIVPMPLNLAVLDPNAGDMVIEDFPEIDSWIIAGHSLGGTMAARFADENTQISGLVFLAAYPEDKLDLSNSNLIVTTLIGSNDGIVSVERIRESLNQLPPTTTFEILEGANHSQFGDYGLQEGDDIATIDYQEQLDDTIDVILAVSESVLKE